MSCTRLFISWVLHLLTVCEEWEVEADLEISPSSRPIKSSRASAPLALYEQLSPGKGSRGWVTVEVTKLVLGCSSICLCDHLLSFSGAPRMSLSLLRCFY